MQLSGRTVLLTGATGGLGGAIARTLHRSGARLVLTGRRADVLEGLAAELDAEVVTVDLSDRDAVAGLAAAQAEADVLVANAGLPGSGTLDSFGVDELDRALDVNLRAPMVLARVLGERMVARRSGHLLFMSSLAGKFGTPQTSVYAATKFGLRGFAQGLRAELAPHRVGVSTVFPGFIRDAGMFHDAGAKLPPGVGTATPQAVADAVVRAITEDRGEIDVAPLSLRVGTAFSGLFPETATRVNRRLGADAIAGQFAAAQQDKRS